MNIHDLKGCSPTPLAHYLKALGILRLVSEQSDSQARGWWEGERFLLATNCSLDELIQFFLERYCPTPMLAPWNGASGFFRTWDKKRKKLRESKNAAALQKLLSQEQKRFEAIKNTYKISLEAVSNVLKEVEVDQLTDKERRNLLIFPRGNGPVFPVADKDEDKETIQRAMTLCCSKYGFYRSAIVDMGDDFGYPSLWGSGGNDGAIDFTARYFENLVLALVDEESQISKDWLLSAITALPAKNFLTNAAGKVGQFLPGGAGGANCTTGFGSQNDTLLNPWDFILMMEGSILFTAHAARRMGTQTSSRAAAPFVVGAQGAGYASSSGADESARGEQWMPLWSQPMTLGELQRLLAEGRAQIGTRAVREPLDLARAVARLGTARGISAFQRYGYIVRNGQSNLAVPLGRFRVPDRLYPRLSCLDDFEKKDWLGRLRRDARGKQGKQAPARLQLVERRLADALFAVTQHPDEAHRWQSVLLGLADVEGIIATNKDFRAGPIPLLRPEWVATADDGSAAYRLAVACALQAAGFRKDKSPTDTVRRHWIAANDDATAIVMKGRSGIDDAIALIGRRLIEAGQRGERRLRLAPAYKAGTAPSDLTALLSGAIDLDHVMMLARALAAVDGAAWGMSPCPPRPAEWGEVPDDAWLAIRLAMLPWPLPDGRKIGVDPAIFRRLASGDGQTATELALRRLETAGIHATVRVAAITHEASRLWAAALAFPITKKTAELFLNRIERTERKGDLS